MKRRFLQRRGGKEDIKSYTDLFISKYKRPPVISVNDPFYFTYRTLVRYAWEIRKITASQPLHLLSNIKERGFRKWNVDHIISVGYGYKNRIPPEIIGHISNLQVISGIENSTKCDQCYCIIEHCNHLRNKTWIYEVI